MPTIVCHPDNADAMLASLERTQTVKPYSFLGGFDVRPDPYMEKTRKSGKYVLPGGEVVEKQDIVVRERFITYGPEDLGWLLWMGIVTEHTEFLYFILNDIFRMQMPSMPKMEIPKSLYYGKTF